MNTFENSKSGSSFCTLCFVWIDCGGRFSIVIIPEYKVIIHLSRICRFFLFRETLAYMGCNLFQTNLLLICEKIVLVFERNHFLVE